MAGAMRAALLCVAGTVLAVQCVCALKAPSPAQGRAGLLQEVLHEDRSNPAELCRPTGQIHDACSDYESVEDMNNRYFFNKLDSLRKTEYFRYFLVDLYKDCPFWADESLCMNRACAVERISEAELPEQFHAYRLSQVEHSVDDTARGSEVSGRSTDFCQLDDENVSGEAIFVDLLKNPERFTGYAGPSANRVWRSIYEENCFGGIKWTEPARSVETGGTGFVSPGQLRSAVNAVPPTLLHPGLASSSPLSQLIASVQAPVDPASMEQCLEKRVFYRVISGLHASISIHICHEYLDPDTKTWAPNLECFVTRISQHPERLQNVYFDYVLMMRALSKAGEYLDKFSLRSGEEIRDPASREQLHELLQLARDIKPSFDEHRLFTTTNDAKHNAETLQLKEDFRQHFQNISRIMDCVGCDKCRLWGKVQVTGIGTALKLLFAFEASDAAPPVELRRSELVALINTAHRISESVRTNSHADSCRGNVPTDVPGDAAARRAEHCGPPAARSRAISDGLQRGQVCTERLDASHEQCQGAVRAARLRGQLPGRAVAARGCRVVDHVTRSGGSQGRPSHFHDVRCWAPRCPCCLARWPWRLQCA